MPRAALGWVWTGAPGMVGGAWRWGGGGVVAGVTTEHSAERLEERWDDGAGGAITMVLCRM
jgi:hypothetical protein